MTCAKREACSTEDFSLLKAVAMENFYVFAPCDVGFHINWQDEHRVALEWKCEVAGGVMLVNITAAEDFNFLLELVARNARVLGEQVLRSRQAIATNTHFPDG